MRLIVLLAFVMGMPGSAPAQQETDPEYWVSQKAAADAEHAALQKNYAELDRQLKADPKKAVREQLEAVRRSEASLKQTRKELEGLVDPYLARALDFIVRALRDEAQARSRDMESADRKAAEQQQGLRRRMDLLASQLATVSVIQDTIEAHIAKLRAEAALSRKAAELNSLQALTGTVELPAPPPPLGSGSGGPTGIGGIVLKPQALVPAAPAESKSAGQE
jgi:hypothetical protein